MTEHSYAHKLKQGAPPSFAPKPQAASVAHHATASGGKALDTQTQRQMGPRFGHDFSQVRIHTDTRATASAQALGANAYAVGSDIVFGPGHYAPGTREGDRLIAHELAHVVQQSRQKAGESGHLSRREDESEQEAEALASQVMQGQDVHVQAAPQAVFAREGAGFLGNPTALQDLWQNIPSASGIGGGISGMGEMLGGSIGGSGGFLGNAITEGGSMLGGGISSVGGRIGSSLSQTSGAVGGGLQTLGGMLGGSVGSEMGGAAGSALSGIGGFLGNGISNLSGGIGANITANDAAIGHEISGDSALLGRGVSSLGSGIGGMVSRLGDLDPSSWL